MAEQIKTVVQEGTQVGIVIGGGNFWRGRTSETIDRNKADQIGMMATIMNCIYVSDICRYLGLQTEVYTPFACGSFTKLYSKDDTEKSFAEGKVVFLPEEPDILIFPRIRQRYCGQWKLRRR